MFKKTLLVFGVIAACSFVQAAAPYVGGAVNYTTLKDARDGGLSVEGQVGTAIGDALRGEMALGYNREDLRGSTIKIWELFANIYYDFNRDQKISPYVLAGLGYGSAGKGNIFGSSSRDGALLSQVGAGVAFPLNEKLLLDLKYRYQMSQDYHLSGTSSFKLTAHQIGLGIRYMF